MAKKAAYGTRLFISDPGDESLIRVHHVADISGPGISVETIDVTSHDSPDGFAEFVAGSADAGEVTFDLFFDPSGAGHARLWELEEERVTVECAIVLPGGETEFIEDSTFSEGDNYWNPGPGWDSQGEGAPANYGSSDPSYNNDLETPISGLLKSEEYKLTVVFPEPGTGITALVVLVEGIQVGTFNPQAGGAQTLYFEGDFPLNSTLTLRVPEEIGVPVNFSISSANLTGIASNDTERFDFTALITKVGVLAPVKDALKASVSLKISGKPEYLSGVPA